MLAIIVTTRFVAPIPLSISQVTTNKESSFNVTGKSSIQAAPDKVVLSLGISQKNPDIRTAQNQANTTINTVTQKLQDLGIKKEDIKTVNYSISPTYNYQTGGQNITGYSVDIMLSVSLTDFQKLNQAVDAATSSGANQVGGIQFTLSDKKEQEVKKQARAEAIANAQSNASELSSLAGMHLGKIINIVEGSANQGPIMYAEAKAPGIGGGYAADQQTTIQPGKNSYTYSVVLSYETL